MSTFMDRRAQQYSLDPPPRTHQTAELQIGRFWLVASVNWFCH